MEIQYINIREKKIDTEPYKTVEVRLKEGDKVQIDVELNPYHVLRALLPLIQSALPDEIMIVGSGVEK